MEALSPRSTNIPLKSKTSTTRQKVDQHAAAPGAAATAQKAAPPKIHAPPPPAIVPEPGPDGETYATGAFLGKGGFAICYEGKLLRNGRIFALKVVRSEMAQKKMAEKFRTELQIHSKMRHPNIVQFHRAFAFEQCTYIVLELCPNGSVMDMVKKRKFLTLPEVRRFMIQLSGAVKYLHKRNVAHRDLKMGNLFLDHNMDIKVGDFGLAAMILSEKDEQRRRTLCGTPNYIAPEVIDKAKCGHTQKVDIWSLGVICFAMLTGYPPFQSKTQEEIYKKVRNLNYVWPKDTESSNYIPMEAKSLVSSCLSLAEDERPEPDDIVEHDFFNMYSGCIPRRLDPSCRQVKPLWLKTEDPRGDRMIIGYSLEYDEKYLTKATRIRDPQQRYAFCRNEFYAECGVGRLPDGTARKAAGKNRSKTAFAENASEEDKGLSPVIPLPLGLVYRYPVVTNGDWSDPEPTRKVAGNESQSDDSFEKESKTESPKTDPASMARMQAALAKVQQRRVETHTQSHAASLRQQALPVRTSARNIATARGVPAGLETVRRTANEDPVGLSHPRGLAQRPVRPTRAGAAAYSATVRDLDRIVAPPMPQPESVTNNLTMGKTRSQSRRQLEAAAQRTGAPYGSIRDQRKHPAEVESKNNERQRSETPQLRETSSSTTVKENANPQEYSRPTGTMEHRSTHSRSASKSGSTGSGSKPRSTLGANPLIHSSEQCELMARSSPEDVMTDIDTMLRNLMPLTTSRRRPRNQVRRRPHAYVIKWVDYTNRYGIGYVLDDGSVGCVFKAEHNQPATCVVVRDGEQHIRRKGRRVENGEAIPNNYSEADQLVPRNGHPVEFYESCDDSSVHTRGIRRVLVAPTVFEVKPASNGSTGLGVRVRSDVGIDHAKCEAEKVKRIKLVDQFGKYMIGSLGRHGDDAMLAEIPSSRVSSQYIKFYQRLGNVGVWGFGDGAFQFNFPDHTKLVISHGPSHTSSPNIDFYHLSASAARYLSAKGKMHPSGFDTRAVTSDEAATLIAVASAGNVAASNTSADDRLRDVLEANSFLSKMEFVRDVLSGWIKWGRLGGRPSTATIASSTLADLHPENYSEIFWKGSQERTASSGKYVWVTVGAQGGDGEYIALSGTPNTGQDDRRDGAAR